MGNRNARKHGAYTADIQERRRELRELQHAIDSMITLVRLRMLEKNGGETMQ